MRINFIFEDAWPTRLVIRSFDTGLANLNQAGGADPRLGKDHQRPH